MREWTEEIGRGLSVGIFQYNAGTYLYRLLIPMKLTRSLGYNSEYEPEDPILFEHVKKAFEKITPWRYAVPGGWDVKDKEELDSILKALHQH